MQFVLAGECLVQSAVRWRASRPPNASSESRPLQVDKLDIRDICPLCPGHGPDKPDTTLRSVRFVRRGVLVPFGSFFRASELGGRLD